MRLRLEPGDGQGPPTILASATGRSWTTTYEGRPAREVRRTEPRSLARTFELVAQDGRFLLAAVRGAPGAGTPVARRASFTLTDVAAEVGLDFRHDAFRFGLTERRDGDDGRRRLLARLRRGRPARPLRRQHVRRDATSPASSARGGLPTSRLFRNLGGRFEDVTAKTGAGLAVRGSGCVAADLDGNGATDLYVTTAGYDAEPRRLRRAALERGRRDVHRGRLEGRSPRLRLARGGGGRRRERRRAARPLRRGLHRPERRAAELDGGVPREPPRPCATSST